MKPGTARLVGDGIGRLFLGLVLVFLYLPILVLALMGFNESRPLRAARSSSAPSGTRRWPTTTA